VHENYLHEDLHRLRSGKVIELDIFLPQEKLAFEYQGEHHYLDVYAVGVLWDQKELDKEKREVCMEKQITLVEIPYWWDKQLASLAATISSQRVDLIPYSSKEKPIPSDPPGGFRAGINISLILPFCG
jgi:hypothetical protein